ncbi:MAG: thiamine phosphate synthase [Planctomycetia bacterium]|nr:thiamine phosphate synthase [Planctomycetia bacterium]
MTWSFTAAAERALAEAAIWRSRDDCADLHTPELLLGLLAETECRAAAMLLARGIDAAAVEGRWPSLARRANGAHGPREFSLSLLEAFEAAVDRLWEYPRPLTLATEHLLLGLVAAPGETGAWLAEHGFDADALEVQIHRLYGHDPGPLSVEALPIDEPVASPRDPSAPPAASEAEARSAGPARGTPDRAESPVPAPAQHVAEPAHVGLPAAVARVLDAAANRAREGLRVVEDYVRMVLDDAHLTRELKELRHDLQAALAAFQRHDLLAGRETQSDVGTTIATADEQVRPDVTSVVAANLKRVEEALRSLEEYGKTCDPAAAARIEQLRYRTYTLERAVDITRAASERLARVRLCVLVDGRSSEAEFDRLVQAILVGGAHMIQLRDKKLWDGELLGRARLLRALSRAAGAISIINDRPDIAALAEADGVQVGQEDLPVKEARAIVGTRALIGVSTHSISQARQAVLDGASYIGVGPTFPSATKEFAAFTGVELLQAVAAEIRLPAFAIGGVTLDNVPAVAAAGFSRVAVAAAVAEARDPRAAAAEFVRRFGHA